MKYMGSKRRIRKDILPLMLKNRHSDQYFVEPFCGGCNVIAHVDGNRLAADINPYLIAMFQGLLNGKQPPQRIDKPLYRKASAQYRSGVGSLSDFEMGWVGFMASFRSKFFSSYAGNTRDGRDYRDLHIPPCSIIYCDIPYRGTTRFEKVPAFSHTDFYEWCFSMKNAGHTVFISEYAMPDAFKLVWEKPIVKNLGDKKTMQAERLYTI